MTTVHITPERLDAYLDAELPHAEHEAVAAHLAACAACADTLDALMRTVSTIRAALPSYSAPDLLRSRVRAALREEGAAHRRPPARRWIGRIAAAALIAVASGGTTLLAVRGLPNDAAARSVEASHVRALASGRLIAVASSDRHTVKPWFAGKVPFAPTIPSLDSLGFPLVGGRVDSADGTRAAVAVYQRRRHVIELYVWPSARGWSGETRIRGHTVIAWRDGDLRYAAVSDVTAEDLRAFAALVQRSR